MIDRLTTRPAMIATGGLCATAMALILLPNDPLQPSLTRQVSPPVPQERLEFESDAAIAPDLLMEEPMVELAPAPMSRAMTGAISERAQIAPIPQSLSETGRDQFASFERGGLQIVSENPVSTFSVDVDTASYSWMRQSLMNGRLPDPASVRIEELVNYFDYAYPGPTGDEPFATHISVAPTPWNSDTRLLHIALQGAVPAVQERAPLNLVFLIDTSGSMQEADKLPLLIQSFRLLLDTLEPEDEVAIVTYAGSAGIALNPTSVTDLASIEAALTRLRAGGSTAGHAGLTEAYKLADQMRGDGEGARVILATDGDFNVGISGTDALEDYIARAREGGTDLSVLGFGQGNYNDALMQTLAQNGNGIAAYIDSVAEARRVLVDRAAGALITIAQDVKVQVEFNPATVAEYRLIGYETRALAREDFNNDRVDAGEIGAGHAVTALYEITPADSAARLTGPLRYGDGAGPVSTSDELAFVQLRYKLPGEAESRLISTPVLPGADAGLEGEVAFAAAVAGSGALLSGQSWTGDWTYDDAIALANATRGEDLMGARSEFVQLMRTVQTLDNLQ